MTTSTTPAVPAYGALEPRAVWKHFAGLAEVPRPSKREERVRDHVRSVAEGLGCDVAQDDAGNLVIRAAASPGHEGVPVTVLQAHLDMVCEKNAGTEHDFDVDPIALVVDRDDDGAWIVRADGTTLGADNGIGVAMALAAVSEPDVVHGPLELLFTVDEEEGMGGAIGLDGDLLEGRRMLNLDTEEDAALYIGCAGGCDTQLAWSFPATLSTDPAFTVTVRGLRGGHSGADIHEGRGAATQLLVRTLERAGVDLRIAELVGGSKRNAIPREARAVVHGAGDLEGALRRAAAEVEGEGRSESAEPGLVIEVTAAEGGQLALGVDDSRLLLRAFLALPHGVAGMHPDIPTLVETSNNFATLTARTEGERILVDVGMLSRGSSASRLRELLDRISALGRLAGADVTRANAYPGWAPNMGSPLLEVCRRVHHGTFGNEPKVEAIHAGLECGLLGEAVPGLDMVSLGPRIEGAHSPDERVWVESVALSWRYLKAILAELAEG
ncbi:MAG: beta-Ala-His dipeptidase [Acidobacteriota bacterium]